MVDSIGGWSEGESSRGGRRPPGTLACRGILERRGIRRTYHHRPRLALPKAPPPPVLHSPYRPPKVRRNPFISGGGDPCTPAPTLSIFLVCGSFAVPLSAAESHGVAGSGEVDGNATAPSRSSLSQLRCRMDQPDLRPEMITQKKKGGRWRPHTGDARTVKPLRSQGSQQQYFLYLILEVSSISGLRSGLCNKPFKMSFVFNYMLKTLSVFLLSRLRCHFVFDYMLKT
jgi:hypothetical protein